MRSALTTLQAQAGVSLPFGFFDPAGFTNGMPIDEMKRYQVRARERECSRNIDITRAPYSR